MGSVQLNHNGDCIEDTSVEQFLSPDSSDYNIFGDPELLPRVGDQYQVEIPALMTESKYLLYKQNPFEVESSPGVPIDFLMGLSVSITWINRVLKSETIKEAQICSQNKDSKVKFEPLEQEMNGEMYQKYKGEGCCLVPGGSSGGSWSDIEEASFLLGLYIFGKNLVQVKKFVESKTMGEIQLFYYGKFYKSEKYRRWSDCRKMRSRRCVYGQRIFSGLRHQELLSRLFVHASEECQNTLLEVSKTFGEGKMPLEEYVSTLKAIVGIPNLVEAVGIGKGKRDLTGTTMEPLKSNHVVQIRPEIPSGKACSSLTPAEIIKFLMGDFRLSKARSNDLFWEAVWPRLLARGWHSEQPKDQCYVANSKHSLVFLMPGVKKFSRKKLTKGHHYFDSVTDVLSKVASDPGLLELDNEADERNRKEENGWFKETKSEEDLSDCKRHCYLQPRIKNHSLDLVKLTVVDTSMDGEKKFKVRELRNSPNKVSKMTLSRNDSEESEEDSSEVSSEDSDGADTNNSNFTKTVSAFAVFVGEKDREIGSSKEEINGPESVKEPKKFCEEKQPRKSLKGSRGTKQDDLDYLAPVTKRRRRLSACNRAETSHQILDFSVNTSLKQEKSILCLETTDSSENNFYEMGLFQKRVAVSSTSSSKSSPFESSEGISCEKPQTRPLIDLNLPQVSPDFLEANDISMTNESETCRPENSKEVNVSEQQPNTNARRQSTRNRPLTARALEALANGFLTTSRRRKNKEALPRDNSRSRPPRCARVETEMTEDFGMGPQMVEDGNRVCKDDRDMFGTFLVLSEENAAQVKGSQISALER